MTQLAQMEGIIFSLAVPNLVPMTMIMRIIQKIVLYTFAQLDGLQIAFYKTLQEITKTMVKRGLLVTGRDTLFLQIRSAGKYVEAFAVKALAQLAPSAQTVFTFHPVLYSVVKHVSEIVIWRDARNVLKLSIKNAESANQATLLTKMANVTSSNQLRILNIPTTQDSQDLATTATALLSSIS